MQFQVPQFIQREIKIAGPLTFKQLMFVAGGGLGVLVFYLILAQRSFFLFITTSIIVVGTGLALAFGKVEGRELPVVITNFFFYLFSGKTYFWRKKAIIPKVIKLSEPKKRTALAPKRPSPKITEKSRLQNLSSKLEVGIK